MGTLHGVHIAESMEWALYIPELDWIILRYGPASMGACLLKGFCSDVTVLLNTTNTYRTLASKHIDRMGCTPRVEQDIVRVDLPERERGSSTLRLTSLRHQTQHYWIP